MPVAHALAESRKDKASTQKSIGRDKRAQLQR